MREVRGGGEKRLPSSLARVGLSIRLDTNHHFAFRFASCND